MEGDLGAALFEGLFPQWQARTNALERTFFLVRRAHENAAACIQHDARLALLDAAAAFAVTTSAAADAAHFVKSTVSDGNGRPAL